MNERKTNLIQLLYIFIVAVGDALLLDKSSSDTRGLHTLRTTTTTRAAPTAHRAEYLCYWFSFLTLLTMGEHARNM
jgi:hypothetical protein